MIELFAIIPWVVTPEEKNFPLMPDGFVGRCTDVTDQPEENIMPDPNLVTFRFRCDEANAALVEADSDIFVLSSEEYQPDPKFKYKRLEE